MLPRNVIVCLVFLGANDPWSLKEGSEEAPSDILNPDQLVSAAGRPAFRRNCTYLQRPSTGHRSSYSSPDSDVSETLRIPVVIIPVTGASEDTVLPHTPIWSVRKLVDTRLCASSVLSFGASSSFFAISSVAIRVFSRLSNFSSCLFLAVGGEWLDY